jgi:two-component system, OmpR family, phosphate regulon sensor histidine kinase PhoR
VKLHIFALMRNQILAATAVAALLGLAIVQYQLLRAGIQLEGQRFEREIYGILQEAEQNINHRGLLRQQIQRLQRQGSMPLASPEWLLPRMVEDSLRQLVAAGSAARGLDFPYRITLAEDFLSNPLAGAPFAGVGQEARWETYSLRLGGILQQECHCNLVLHLQVEQTLGLLLRRLQYILVPSAVFLLLLLGLLLLLLRTLQRQERLARAKNDFINNLAHELKTPAFSISLLAKLLRQGLHTGSREKSEEYLALLEQENEQIKTQIEKVLELASLESARYPMELRPARLHPLLASVAAHYRLRAESLGGSLSCRFAAEQDMVQMDEGHLRNILQNLLDNAVKYSSAPPVIELATANKGGKALIAVSDRGPGIAPEHQRRIFDKFYRVPNGQAIKGFGLGLNYAREAVRAQGGDIRLESAPGKGSTFFVELPLAGPLAAGAKT